MPTPLPTPLLCLAVCPGRRQTLPVFDHTFTTSTWAHTPAPHTFVCWQIHGRCRGSTPHTQRQRLQRLVPTPRPGAPERFQRRITAGCKIVRDRVPKYGDARQEPRRRRRVRRVRTEAAGHRVRAVGPLQQLLRRPHQAVQRPRHGEPAQKVRVCVRGHGARNPPQQRHIQPQRQPVAHDGSAPRVDGRSVPSSHRSWVHSLRGPYCRVYALGSPLVPRQHNCCVCRWHRCKLALQRGEWRRQLPVLAPNTGAPSWRQEG